MFWRKLAGQSTKEGAVKSTEANRLVFAPGAAKLLQVSLERVAEAESIDEMDTILFHAMEGTFADQSRAEEYVGVYSEKLAEDDRDYESCERLLITLLRSLLDQIEAAPPQYQTKQRPRTGKVFVVHGHDLKIRDQVCEILESFSLTPVILAETAGSSQTIIELVEKHGGVDHAVCLLTADDVGGSRSGSLRPRAPECNLGNRLLLWLARSEPSINCCRRRRGVAVKHPRPSAHNVDGDYKSKGASEGRFQFSWNALTWRSRLSVPKSQ